MPVVESMTDPLDDPFPPLLGLAQPNAIQRGIQLIGATRVGTWSFRTLLLPLDRRLVRGSEGRRSLPGFLLGLPVAMLTTIGARTGLDRTAPVVVLRDGRVLAILGTNFGQQRAPAWQGNLAACSSARLTWRGVVMPVRARRADDREEERIWAVAERAYPGFRAYRRRITGRNVGVWVLEPA